MALLRASSYASRAATTVAGVSVRGFGHAVLSVASARPRMKPRKRDGRSNRYWMSFSVALFHFPASPLATSCTDTFQVPLLGLP